MSEEWGPWIEHDGKGCPCRGAIVESVERCGRREVHVALGRGSIWMFGNPRFDSWHHLPKHTDITYYRIRKPRGLTILVDLLETLPERVDA